MIDLFGFVFLLLLEELIFQQLLKYGYAIQNSKILELGHIENTR